MSTSVMKWSVVKWSEGLRNRVCIIIRRYTDHMKFYCFFRIILVLFHIIVYVVICFVCFCPICNIMYSYCYDYVFLLLRLCILIVTIMYSYCYDYVFLLLRLCILIVTIMYSYYYVCSVVGIVFHCVILCIVCV